MKSTTNRSTRAATQPTTLADRRARRRARGQDADLYESRADVLVAQYGIDNAEFILESEAMNLAANGGKS